MSFRLPPPPVGNDVSSPAFRDWFYKLGQAFSQAGSILWSAITLPVVSQNTFLGGPTSGTAQASFRAISSSDLGSGTANTTTFLRGDQTWQVITGGSGNTYNNTYMLSGFDGEEGPEGFPIPGNQGVQGIQGLVGPQGPPGVDGQDGDDGLMGPPGPQGPQGTNGYIGSNGAPGIDGFDGEDGLMGPPGPMGPQGTQGIQGPVGNSVLYVGIPGQDGDDGNDQYYLFGGISSGSGVGSGLTHPQVLTRVSFRF